MSTMYIILTGVCIWQRCACVACWPTTPMPSLHTTPQTLAEVPTDGEPNFKVHYKGWSSKFDEVVHVDRIVKVSPESKAKAEAMQAAARSETRSSKRSKSKRKRASDASSVASEASSVPSNRGSEPAAGAAKSARRQTSLLRLNLPSTAKTGLVQDWEMVVSKRCLVRLPKPAGTTVADICKAYLGSLPQEDASSLAAAKDVMAGVQIYFDRCAPVFLLYRFERLQFDSLLSEHLTEHPTEPLRCSAVFGAEHLLRFLAKLPDLLTDLSVPRDTLSSLSSQLEEFAKWLGKSSKKYLTQDYIRADTSYVADTLKLPEKLAVDLAVLPPLTPGEQELVVESQRHAAAQAAQDTGAAGGRPRRAAAASASSAMQQQAAEGVAS